MHWTDIKSTREGHAEPSSTLSRKALLQKGWQSHVRTPHEGFRPYLDLFKSLIAPSTWHNSSQNWSTLNNHHQSQCTLLKKNGNPSFLLLQKGSSCSSNSTIPDSLPADAIPSGSPCIQDSHTKGRSARALVGNIWRVVYDYYICQRAPRSVCSARMQGIPASASFPS